MTALMLPTGPAPLDVATTVRKRGGGGPRRIAESATGVVVTHGEGAELIDTMGRRYLDFATAMGVAAIGHADEHWADSVATQARRLAACVLHTPQHAEYLERLAEVLPCGVDRVALYSGGAEAVEVAVRLAQSHTGRRRILSFTTGFHGKTLGVRFSGGRFPDEQPWVGANWTHHVPYPACHEHDVTEYPRCRDDGRVELEELARCADAAGGAAAGGAAAGDVASDVAMGATTVGGADDVAAVIVEPVLGTAGNVPGQRGFLAALRALCTARGWLLIVDESITGFGRLGTHFAAQYFGVTPDILVLGKAMGGGYPLSGVAAPAALWDGSLYAEMSATSSSYGANPLACAAGLAVLDITESEGFLDNVRAVARRLAEGLVQIARASPYVGRPRGVGMMLGFDFVDPATGALADPALCGRLFRACLEAGLLIVGDVPRVRLNPPLILTDAQADQAIDALARAVCR